LASLRIIAGSLKGRRLKTPDWDGLRPTSDKLRETLFNVLAPRIAGARVLDAFAGTGALGIEALSRAAAAVTFVEQDRRAQALIEANLARCGIDTGYTVLRSSVAHAADQLRGQTPFDIVLMDPPYDAPPGPALAALEPLVTASGIVVFEHSRRTEVPTEAGRLVRVRQVISGDSVLSLYELGTR
jgi:16S rRNA (guanine(966)-N(2))-methyltransferase RsmD